MERPAPVVLRERVDLRPDPEERDEQPRDPEREQRPLIPDQPHDPGEHPEAVTHRVQLVLVGDVVGDRDRDLGHLQAEGREVGDHVRLDAVTLRGEGQVLKGSAGERPEARLGVGRRKPAVGREVREPVEDLLAGDAVLRDIGLDIEEPGADDEVSLARKDRGRHGRDLLGVVLAVAVEHHDGLVAQGAGTGEPGHHRPRLAAVLLEPDDVGAGEAGDRGGPVR